MSRQQQCRQQCLTHVSCNSSPQSLCHYHTVWYSAGKREQTDQKNCISPSPLKEALVRYSLGMCRVFIMLCGISMICKYSFYLQIHSSFLIYFIPGWQNLGNSLLWETQSGELEFIHFFFTRLYPIVKRPEEPSSIHEHGYSCPLLPLCQFPIIHCLSWCSKTTHPPCNPTISELGTFVLLWELYF